MPTGPFQGLETENIDKLYSLSEHGIPVAIVWGHARQNVNNFTPPEARLDFFRFFGLLSPFKHWDKPDCGRIQIPQKTRLLVFISFLEKFGKQFFIAPVDKSQGEVGWNVSALTLITALRCLDTDEGTVAFRESVRLARSEKNLLALASVCLKQ